MDYFIIRISYDEKHSFCTLIKAKNWDAAVIRAKTRFPKARWYDFVCEVAEIDDVFQSEEYVTKVEDTILGTAHQTS
jgi:hypothetical protein